MGYLQILGRKCWRPAIGQMATRRAQRGEFLEDPLNEAQEIVNDTLEAVSQSQLMQKALASVSGAAGQASSAAGGAAPRVAQVKRAPSAPLVPSSQGL
jgi:hypothetical protein